MDKRCLHVLIYTLMHGKMIAAIPVHMIPALEIVLAMMTIIIADLVNLQAI